MAKCNGRKNYPLLDKMRTSYGGYANGDAFEYLKSSALPSACEHYANAHPDIPFYNELIGINAALSAAPGSAFYKEHFAQKFSSAGALIAASVAKIDGWLQTHPNDMDVLCIRAGIEVVIGISRNRYAGAGHLIRVMKGVTDAERFSQSDLWVTAANAIKLWEHLDFLAQQEQKKAALEADKITSQDVWVTWLFVGYPILVATLSVFGYSHFDWFATIGFIGMPILLIILSCNLYTKLLHKPLKVTLSVIGCLSFLWGYMQYEVGGAQIRFMDALRQLSMGIVDERAFGWYLVLCLVMVMIIIAICRTSKYFSSHRSK